VGLFDGVSDWFSGFGGGESQDLGTRGSTSLAPDVLSGGGSGAYGSAGGGIPFTYGGMSPTPDTGGGSWFQNLFGGGGGAGGGGSSTSLNDILGIAGKAAGLGSSILGGVGSIQAMSRGAQNQRVATGSERQLQQLGQRTSEAALPLMTMGSAGLQGQASSPYVEAQVDQWKRESLAKFRDQAVRMGLNESTALSQWESWVAENEAIMRGQLYQQMYGAGLQGVGAAYQPTYAAGAVATQAMGSAANQTNNVYRNIAQIMGSQ
jgi:hypothetical protein